MLLCYNIPIYIIIEVVMVRCYRVILQTYNKSVPKKLLTKPVYCRTGYHIYNELSRLFNQYFATNATYSKVTV